MVDSTLFSLATLNAHPAMNPDSVIQGDHWRIGLITDALVRFEWSDSGRFVDDATQMAMVRDFGEKPEFTVTERNGWLEIDTPSLHISYNQRKFSPEGLYATVKHVNAIENTWHYGDVQRRNLGGTYRTLDEANGRIPVDPGVNSTDGWAIIDDSKSNVIRETAEVNGNHNDFGTWVTPKEEPTTDLYLFGYGHRYREAVHALYRLTGPTPLLPRFVRSACQKSPSVCPQTTMPATISGSIRGLLSVTIWSIGNYLSNTTRPTTNRPIRSHFVSISPVPHLQSATNMFCISNVFKDHAVEYQTEEDPFGTLKRDELL
mgnify:CR=1 FL=1